MLPNWSMLKLFPFPSDIVSSWTGRAANSEGAAHRTAPTRSFENPLYIHFLPFKFGETLGLDG
jgi:hypothetical protein